MRCDAASICASRNSRCGSRLHVRYPPNLAGAALPVSRNRFDHLTTVEGAISNCTAIARQVSPKAIAVLTRLLKSSA